MFGSFFFFALLSSVMCVGCGGRLLCSSHGPWTRPLASSSVLLTRGTQGQQRAQPALTEQFLSGTATPYYGSPSKLEGGDLGIG